MEWYPPLQILNKKPYIHHEYYFEVMIRLMPLSVMFYRRQESMILDLARNAWAIEHNTYLKYSYNFFFPCL